MYRLLYLAIILSLSCPCILAQNRNRTAKKPVETINFEAETEKKLRTYDIDAAVNLLDRWEASLDASGREYPASYESMRARALNTRNLLERVEKIELIDTMLVDADDFFANYMLSPSTGDLLDALSLPEEYSSRHPKVVFTPQNGKEMIWGEPSARTGSRIVVSSVLDDGTITAPESIGDAINDMKDADYPFIQDDGMTIYFAAKGENSLGGYDIFMTRRTPDGELMQPQNIGMPYNSPFNDYMMVIDDARNLGWWASDRSGIPGKVTIYVFRPSAMRVNYDSDDEYIVDHALLRDTMTKGGLEALLEDKVVEEESDQQKFVFSLGDGRVYSSLTDFKKPAAQRCMEELIFNQEELKRLNSEIERLRKIYAQGDKRTSTQIRDMEKQLDKLSASIRDLSNRVISIENK